jgi:uncharacterized membrane protein
MADVTDSLRSTQNEAEVMGSGWGASLFGLGTALCFAISPIFIRGGLKGLPSPLLGVTIGIVTCVIAYGLTLLLLHGRSEGAPIPHDALLFQFAAGMLIGLSTWARWIALDLAPVAVVLALGRINVPLVILLSPFMVGHQLERVTPRVWLGAVLIVSGSLLLIFYG